VDCGGGRGIAGDDQRLDCMPIDQLLRHRARPFHDEEIVTLTVRCEARVGQVDEGFGRQLLAQRAQDAQAADAAVEDTNAVARGNGVRAQFRTTPRSPERLLS
jgi:ribosomal protein S18 acetylase RimI-like enzyme